MSIVFSQDNLGRSVGYQVEGAVPASKISLGIDQDVPYTGDWLNNAVTKPLKDFFRDLYNEYGAGVINKILKGAELSLETLTKDGATPEEVRDILVQQGLNKISRPPSPAGSVLGYNAATDEVKRRSAAIQQPLDKFIKPLGLLLGASVQFTENANIIGLQVEASPQQLYTGSLSGIVFDGACTENPQTHGLEPLLEYYWYHRVSNPIKDLTKTTLKIGSTVLRGWVVGMNIEPLNLDFRIWSWSIHLMISPDYRPNSTYRGPLPSRLRSRRTFGVGEGSAGGTVNGSLTTAEAIAKGLETELIGQTGRAIGDATRAARSAAVSAAVSATLPGGLGL